eukprot:2002917-Prymnesium_polylepis.2
MEFFCNTGAPKCAARFMELKNELVLAPRNKFLEDAARARIVRNATALLEKDNLHPLVKGQNSSELAAPGKANERYDPLWEGGIHCLQ